MRYLLILTIFLSGCYHSRGSVNVENEKKLRYNYVSEEYEYAEEDEKLKYNPIEKEYTYE
jgi:hypothetical protein